jgi:hypothetical protein
LAELGGSTSDTSVSDAMFGEWDAFDDDETAAQKDS